MSRVNLPDWPRLMPIDLAAAYLGISAGTFQTWGIAPTETPGRRVLYDRRSLDLFADRLAGQPLSADDMTRAASDEERAFFRDRESRNRV